MAAELEARRHSDQPKYTEADFERYKLDVQDQTRLSGLSGQVGKLEGAVENMPAQMEVVARRVFTELFTMQQTEASRQNAEHATRRWRNADTLAAMGQLILAVAVLAVAVVR